MNSKKAKHGSDPLQGIKKFFLSAFVILTFMAYYFHERNTNPATANTNNTTANTGSVPTAAAASQAGFYKNGTYTGPEVDAYYGLVQVQVVIQNGKITNVQFLEYPHDRRTSQQIN